MRTTHLIAIKLYNLIQKDYCPFLHLSHFHPLNCRWKRTDSFFSVTLKKTHFLVLIFCELELITIFLWNNFTHFVMIKLTTHEEEWISTGRGVSNSRVALNSSVMWRTHRNILGCRVLLGTLQSRLSSLYTCTCFIGWKVSEKEEKKDFSGTAVFMKVETNSGRNEGGTEFK